MTFELKNVKSRLEELRSEKNNRLSQQAEFFVADMGNCSLKIDQVSMEAPIFSLSKKTDHDRWSWKSVDGKKSIEVLPGFYGRATQHDKDLLIYCTSHLVAAINEGRAPPRIVRFSAYDFLLNTNRNTRGDDYNRLRDTLNRLAGTQIMTNIMTGGKRAAKGFGIIDSWEVISKSHDDCRMVAIEVKLSDWLFNAINAKEVLTISKEYFNLSKPLERRLYEIARKHVGKQASWSIGIEALQSKCGSKVSRPRQFRGELEKIINDNNLPDYRMLLTLDNKVMFYSKDIKKMAELLLKKAA